LFDRIIGLLEQSGMVRRRPDHLLVAILHK
jgi:hypothetical protein